MRRGDVAELERLQVGLARQPSACITASSSNDSSTCPFESGAPRQPMPSPSTPRPAPIRVVPGTPDVVGEVGEADALAPLLAEPVPGRLEGAAAPASRRRRSCCPGAGKKQFDSSTSRLRSLTPAPQLLLRSDRVDVGDRRDVREAEPGAPVEVADERDRDPVRADDGDDVVVEVGLGGDRPRSR